jgi:hypothetical protein
MALPPPGVVSLDHTVSPRKITGYEEESTAKMGAVFFQPYHRASNKCRMESRM